MIESAPKWLRQWNYLFFTCLVCSVTENCKATESGRGKSEGERERESENEGKRERDGDGGGD